MDSPNNPNHAYNSTVYKFKNQVGAQAVTQQTEEQLIAKLRILEKRKAELIKEIIEEGIGCQLEVSTQLAGLGTTLRNSNHVFYTISRI